MKNTTNNPSCWSLRSFLIWLILACLLPGIIGAVALFAYEYRASHIQLQKNTIQTARALVQAVDNHLLRAQAVAQSLAASDTLTRRDYARFHAQAREVMEQVGLGTNAVLRDETGRQILNTAVEFGAALSPLTAPEQVRKVFATGKPTTSDVFTGPVLGRPVMSVDVPVMRNGRIIYALGVGILPEHFNAILKTQGLPSDWIVAVFDSSGAIVGRTHAAAQFVGKKASAQLFQSMMASPEGALEATTSEGIAVQSFYSSSPLTNWRVAIGIPREAIEGAFIRTLSMIAMGVAALFGIGLVLARFMSGRIEHAVEVLTTAANALGRGSPIPDSRIHIKEAANVADAIQRADELLKERAATIAAKESELAEAHRLARFGTWHKDLATGEVKISDSAREIYGRAALPFAEMRGTMLPVESWERMNNALQETAQTGKGHDLVVKANHASGKTIWVNFKCEAVRNEQGEIAALRGAIQDISARREIEEELRKFKFFSDHSNDGLLLLDRAGSIRYANKLVGERLGYSEAELLRMRIMDIAVHAADRFPEIFERSKKARIPPFETIHRRKDGSTFPVEVTATVLEVKGEWMMFATSRDITERKLTEQRVRDAALHDVLTGLPNRALVMEYCERLLAAAKRSHSRGALLFIDLDRFKPINDLYGHEAGDRVLREVSRRLVACTRQEDLVGRLGGDEFVIVLPYVEGDRHRAASVAQHVVDSISRPIQVDNLELSVSPSIGISYFPEHATEVNALMHTADMAMYQAKQAGRANYQFYTPELDQRAAQALMMEAKVRQALKQGGFRLYYQPVIDIRSGKLIGAEALVRLMDDNGEIIGPDRFIPIAESAGLIGNLGEWVATEACRQHTAWLRQGMQLTIAINVSPLQFRERAFAEKIGNIISRSGIDPSYLEVEVTESAVMENIDNAIEILNRIKSLGVKVALDDFGTGYSSLSSLSTLPLDKLKVDQSFVRRIGRDQASRAVTEAIIALGRTLQLNVVGEGIESDDALQYLQKHGCDQAQGYWFSQPLPADQFMQWYNEQWAMKTGTDDWDRVKRIWSQGT